ncbi:Hypothetical predicted protein [Octopus vulgaris]|uniref:Uncharacterized protein n=1 Tax=Octopus vulgaris TaxID=6645 RepID=A0AA36AJ17_OCTVU|nr:Hypothetical predicted protein [Octopus vulgaris]
MDHDTKVLIWCLNIGNAVGHYWNDRICILRKNRGMKSNLLSTLALIPKSSDDGYTGLSRLSRFDRA